MANFKYQIKRKINKTFLVVVVVRKRLLYFISLNKECLLSQVTKCIPPYILPSFIWSKFKGYILTAN